MECWAKATSIDLRLFQIIAGLVGVESGLLTFLFNADSPKLRLPADELIQEAIGLCSSDYVVVKLAVDLWCEQGKIPVHELLSLDEPLFSRTLRALAQTREPSTVPAAVEFAGLRWS